MPTKKKVKINEEAGELHEPTYSETIEDSDSPDKE